MKINVNGVVISFDNLIEGYVPITYNGKKEKIKEMKERLSVAGGKYGNCFDPDFCLAIDLVSALQNNFKVKIDSNISIYDPPLDDGEIP
ncbi:hypothetical protein COY25_00335 [Candidatus Uhrbacteria bacterium CG_4_10_14_0_2_um_filter_41_7]|nr:MAG: hypothetical protein COY25_00335 [Candidatus Uhrbacteria bacterium CG_4_10_14_0_2_um_filter_41_7]